MTINNRILDEDYLEFVAGGQGNKSVLSPERNNHPKEGLDEFIHVAKNEWGMDLDQAVDNLTVNWSKYHSYWKHGDENPDYESCYNYLMSHWKNAL